MNSNVSLIRVANPPPTTQDIDRALQLIEYKPPAHINSVVIKANLCYYWNASTGQTTDPALVGVVIDYLREKLGADLDIQIAEADASAMQTKYAFKLLGYQKLAEQKNVKLLNLCQDNIQDTEVTVDGRKLSLKVPAALLESDLFVNMPKLKVMRQVHITCAMKNLFGAIAYPRKAVYHKTLDSTIVAINKILKPHLNIVDGLVALGKYPIRLNLLMAGTSTFAVDHVAARILGYQPSKVNFLNLAAKEHLGAAKDIAVKGERIEVFSRVVPTESNTLAKVKMGMQFSLIKAYSKVSGDVIPPVVEDS